MLKRYKINIKQIIGATTDNGKNMIKSAEFLTNENNQSSCENCMETEDVDVYDEIEDIEPFLLEIKRSDRIENILCSAHTFQLGIRDFLDLTGFPIQDVRKFVKISRKPSFTEIFIFIKF